MARNSAQLREALEEREAQLAKCRRGKRWQELSYRVQYLRDELKFQLEMEQWEREQKPVWKCMACMVNFEPDYGVCPHCGSDLHFVQ